MNTTSNDSGMAACRIRGVPRQLSPYAAMLIATLCVASVKAAEDFGPDLQRAIDLEREGKVDEAIPYAERASALAEELSGKISLDSAHLRVFEGELYAKAGKPNIAEARFKKGLGVFAVIAPQSSANAKSLFSFGVFYRSLGKHADAIPYLKQSLEIQRAQAKPNVDHIANTLFELAQAFRDQEDHDGAVSALQDLAAVVAEQHGPRSTQTAQILKVLADAQIKTKRLEAARHTYERCLGIYESQFFLFQDVAAISECQEGLADVLRDLGQYADAQGLYAKVLAGIERSGGKEHADTIVVCRRIAECLAHQGDYASAETFAERAVQAAEKNYGIGDARGAAAIDTLAGVCRLQGKWEDAQQLYERAVKLSEETYGPTHRETATSLLNLGTLYADREEYEKALSATEGALAIYKAQSPLDVMDVAIATHNLGLVYWSLGKHAEAEALLRGAKNECEKQLGQKHPHVAMMLNDLAMNLFFLDKKEEGRQCATQALSLVEESLGPDHPAAVRPRITLAVILAAQQDWEAAARTLDEGNRKLVRQINRLLPSLSASEQLAILKAGPSRPYNASLTAAMTRPEDAELCELSAGWLANMKALGHEALALMSLLTKSLRDPEDARRAEQLNDVRQQLAALAQAPPSLAEEAAHRDEYRRLEKVERDLVHEIGGQLATIYDSSGWTDLDDIRARLPENGVLVDLARVRVFDFEATSWATAWKSERYAAWVIPPAGRGRVRVVDLGPAESIDRLVSAHRQGLRDSLGSQGLIATHGEKSAETMVRQKGSLLAKAVFEPVESVVRQECGERGAETLLVCPDGDLWLVPWAALPLDDEQYVVERYSVLTLTSAREVIRERVPRQAESPAVVFADPDYDLVRENGASEKTSLPRVAGNGAGEAVRPRRIGPVRRLPGSKVESELLQPVLFSLTNSKPAAYIGPDATESAAKALRGPRIAHFATHGFFLSDQRSDPATTEHSTRSAGEVHTPKPLRGHSGDHLRSPFLRSGLLLAGCNSTTRGDLASADDGVLTGTEVLGIDLVGTELAVLSACETGVGDVHCGEGVAGLRQAFLIAGAGAVLATLWHVEDTSTTDLMTSFFEQWDSGKSPAEALAGAQRAAISAGRRSRGAAHPVYWGAFELTQ